MHCWRSNCWRRRIGVVAVVIGLAPGACLAQLPAFPGAGGAGGDVTGGRGGIVYHVTKLDQNFNDNVEGTLRYGLSDGNFAPGTHRTIVFDVAGTFWLGRYGAERGHFDGWDTQSRLNLGSNVTIAGQTAPGPVNIMGGVVKANGDNVVIRNVTIAPGYGMRGFEKPDEGVYPSAGDFPDSYTYDALDISGVGVMIDHVTTLYATDETISANEEAADVTIQYSNISQGQNYPQADAESSSVRYTGHALGSLLQAGSGAQISVRNNLYAHQKGRLPRVGSEEGTGPYNDFRNNVFYNWFGTAGTGGGGQPSFNNFLSNFYLAGPGGDDVSQLAGPDGRTRTLDDIGVTVTQSGGTGIFSGDSVTRVYASGNLKDTNKDGDPNDTTAASYSGNIQAAAYDVDRGALLTAQAAFDDVLQHMGARWWERDYDYQLGNTAAIDTPDERLVHETYTGAGKIVAWADNPFNDDYTGAPEPFDPNEGQEWRDLLALRADPSTGAAPFNRAAGWDADGDGMPGFWEEAHGLNPAVANNNADFDSDGYTDLEEYLNDVAAWPAPGLVEWTGGNGRYAEIGNWRVFGETINIQGAGNVMSASQWQPSRYDDVVIGGTSGPGLVTVDAVGQHAGTLTVGQASGSSDLYVESGWLKVANELNIAPIEGGGGAVTVRGGRLFAGEINIGLQGRLEVLTGGTLSAEVVNIHPVAGGFLQIVGGRVAPADIADFDPDGVVTVASEVGAMAVHAGLWMLGELAIDLAGASPGEYDRVVVDHEFRAGGQLVVSLLDGFTPGDGDVFDILDFNNATGSFSSVSLPGLSPGLTWNTFHLLTTGELLVQLDGNADFNRDGAVDGADFLAWQRGNGLTSSAAPRHGDANRDGAVNQDDLAIWQSQFGTPPPLMANFATVPEPSALALCAVLSLSCAVLACRGRR